jgi:hypothetical protein
MYEEMIANARASSARMAGQGVDSILREMEWRDWWGHMGSGIGCLVGLLAGMVFGGPIGMVILAIAFGILGRILGTYAKEVLLLLFLLLRIFVFGKILELLVVSTYHANWPPQPLSAALTGIIYKALVTALIFGLLRIGSAAMMGRLIRFPEVSVLLQSNLGAWLGAFLGMMLVIYWRSGSVSSMPLIYWLAMFSLYLLIDAYVFARPVVIILTDRLKHSRMFW